jgi:hypothetical protein
MRRLFPLAAALLLLPLAGGSLGCSFNGMIEEATGMQEAAALQASGLAATAQVLSVWDTGTTINENPVIGLVVQVRPENREPYEATIKKSVVSRLDLAKFQPGMIIPVRVDPKDPSRVAVDLYH